MLVLNQSTVFVQTCRVLFHVRQSYICKGPKFFGYIVCIGILNIWRWDSNVQLQKYGYIYQKYGYMLGHWGSDFGTILSPIWVDIIFRDINDLMLGQNFPIWRGRNIKCPKKKNTISIVNNCFRFQDKNFYFEPFDKRGLTFFIWFTVYAVSWNTSR